MCSAIVVVECAGAKIGWFDSLSDDVRFSDPRSLGVGQDDGDGVASGLEVLHEGVDVRGGLVGGRSVVVHYLYLISLQWVVLGISGALLTRICIFV